MDKIGKYEIREQIGVGGFGAVYKGFDPFIKRFVAVKTCNSNETEIRTRFFQEAEIAGNLHHRNITTVYDFGVFDEIPYLIQEYLSGEDLDRKVKRRDYLPYPEKLYYLLQIARGLSKAHAEGVIHRDIKPANVRVLEDGTVKIMDFGIAKLAKQQSDLTKTGMTIGTAAYLAPEQIRGEPVEPSTDIFSFGVLAYELLTYERPFKGEEISAVLYQILNQQPTPLNERWAECPAEMLDLVDRCLAKDPKKRPVDSGELLRELEAIQQGQKAPPSVPAPTATPPPLPPPGPDLATPSGEEKTVVRREESSSRPLTAAAPTLAPTVTLETPSGTTDRHLAELELSDMAGSSTPAARPRQASGNHPQTGHALSRRSALLLVGGLALVAAVGGWWLGQRGKETPVAPPTAVAEADPDGATTADGSGTDGSGTDGSAPANGGAEISAGGAANDSAAAANTDTATAPPVEPEAEPPPPEPEKGTIIVPPVAWTENVMVSLGRTPYSLERQRTFPLDAGTYNLQFTVALGDYRDESTVTVQLAAGERREVSSPLQQPGGLTVRARPGRPQGEVVVDAVPRGPSPLGGLVLKAGDHQVEIRSLSDPEASSPLTLTVSINPGEESVVTFDLESGAPPTVLTKPLGS